MLNKPEDFIVYHHTRPKKEAGYSFTVLKILRDLEGLPWCDLTLCYVLAMRPSAIRVSTGCVTADAYPNRITVFIDNSPQKIIKEIHMEVAIPSDGKNGYELDQELQALRSKHDCNRHT